MEMLAVLPLKAFTAAKGRLDGFLEPPAREALSRAVAGRVAAACIEAGHPVVVVTADGGVAAWAAGLGMATLPEPPGGGLDGAAAAGAAEARRRGWAWCIVHGDLPLLTPGHLTEVARGAGPATAALAPSRHGGTNLLAAAVPVAFAYGARSFTHHLAATRHLDRRVMVTLGTALDLDTPEDLKGAAALPGGRWLQAYLT